MVVEEVDERRVDCVSRHGMFGLWWSDRVPLGWLLSVRVNRRRTRKFTGVITVDVDRACLLVLARVSLSRVITVGDGSDGRGTSISGSI